MEVSSRKMTNMLGSGGGERDLNFKETELCLGLPGGCGTEPETLRATGKRGFSETVDLKLNLHQSNNKEDLSENIKKCTTSPKEKSLLPNCSSKPPAK